MTRDKLGDYIFQHFDIEIVTVSSPSDVMYELVGTEMKFDDISELLLFYQTTPVSDEVAGIGDCVEGISTVDSFAPLHHTKVSHCSK